METKYIFVTGGVSSSLGKGIIAASLGKLLQSRGFRVTIQKLDPYINVDPGTLNPYEHRPDGRPETHDQQRRFDASGCLSVPTKRRKPRARDIRIQIAHQCTMQEREKQPASDAGKKKKEIVTTCSRD